MDISKYITPHMPVNIRHEIIKFANSNSNPNNPIECYGNEFSQLRNKTRLICLTNEKATKRDIVSIPSDHNKKHYFSALKRNEHIAKYFASYDVPTFQYHLLRGFAFGYPIKSVLNFCFHYYIEILSKVLNKQIYMREISIFSVNNYICNGSLFFRTHKPANSKSAKNFLKKYGKVCSLIQINLYTIAFRVKLNKWIVDNYYAGSDSELYSNICIISHSESIIKRKHEKM